MVDDVLHIHMTLGEMSGIPRKKWKWSDINKQIGPENWSFYFELWRSLFTWKGKDSETQWRTQALIEETEERLDRCIYVHDTTVGNNQEMSVKWWVDMHNAIYRYHEVILKVEMKFW